MDPLALAFQFICLWVIIYIVVLGTKFYIATKVIIIIIIIITMSILAIFFFFYVVTDIFAKPGDKLLGIRPSAKNNS